MIMVMASSMSRRHSRLPVSVSLLSFPLRSLSGGGGVALDKGYIEVPGRLAASKRANTKSFVQGRPAGTSYLLQPLPARGIPYTPCSHLTS